MKYLLPFTLFFIYNFGYGQIATIDDGAISASMYEEEEVASIYHIFNEFDQRNDSASPKHKRRMFIGGGLGLGVNVSDSDEVGVGFRLSLLDAGILFNNWAGMHVKLTSDAFVFDYYDDALSFVNFFAGPMFSIPAGKILDIDFRPMIGFSYVQNVDYNYYYYEESIWDFAAGAAVTFRFNLGRHIALMVSPELYALSDTEFSNLMLNVGVAYRAF